MDANEGGLGRDVPAAGVTGVLERIIASLASVPPAVRALLGQRLRIKGSINWAPVGGGFALLDVLQPCVTFNKLNTYDFFTQRCYKLQDHDSSDKLKALEKAMNANHDNEKALCDYTKFLAKQGDPKDKDKLKTLADGYLKLAPKGECANDMRALGGAAPAN